MLVRWIAPEAGGSGIPQVLAANDLNQKHHRSFVNRILSLKVTVVKIVSSLVCLIGGGAIGREGPTVQISASIFQFFRRFSRKIHPTHDAQPWIVAGAAAGLASAFNTPLGGLVYAIEELGVTHFQKLRIHLFSAVIIAGLVSQWLHGNYLYLGFPQLNSAGFSFLPMAIMVGVASGLLGAVFGKILSYLVQKTAMIKKVSMAMLLALGCGVVLSGLTFLDQRAAGSGKEVIMDLLFHGQTAGLMLVLLRFVSTLATYVSGVAGGIFAPSLAIGAALGSAMAQIFHDPNGNLMMMLGMIGFLTGVTRTPFTSFVLVLEMTDRHSAIFPMMLAAIGASATAHFIDPRSFYEIMRERFVLLAEKEKSPVSPQNESFENTPGLGMNS
jgi:H+/Cl- antiporter ClcA